MDSLWIAELLVSQRTAEKLSGKHHLSPDEVRDALVCVEGLPFAVDVDPERGERVIVATWLRGRPVRAVLYAAEHPLGDVWHLGSVYFVDR